MLSDSNPSLSDSDELGGSVVGEYEVIRLIGRGTFSRVYESRSRESDERVALKIIKNTQSSRQQFDSVCIFETELDSLMRISSHENVLKLIDAFETADQSLVIVSEYCDSGDLFGLIRQRGRLSELECKLILRSLLRGLLHIHTKHRISHRDLKLENVLLTSDGRVVLADFGLSKAYNSVLLTRCGSEEYAAPEVIMGKPYEAEKADVWSFGVVMFACLQGRLPFLRNGSVDVNSGSPLSLYAQILGKNLSIDGLSEDCRRVLEASLERDTRKRAVFKDLLSMAYFK